MYRQVAYKIVLRPILNKKEGKAFSANYLDSSMSGHIFMFMDMNICVSSF